MSPRGNISTSRFAAGRRPTARCSAGSIRKSANSAPRSSMRSYNMSPGCHRSCRGIPCSARARSAESALPAAGRSGCATRGYHVESRSPAGLDQLGALHRAARGDRRRRPSCRLAFAWETRRRRSLHSARRAACRAETRPTRAFPVLDVAWYGPVRARRAADRGLRRRPAARADGLIRAR